MRWSKRAAALLASLLLLLTAVQAGGMGKEPSARERPVLNTRLTAPGEEREASKIPELTVVTPEPVKEPERAAESAKPEARTAEAASGEERKDPVFPEAEDWQILLVNPWNEMPEDYEVTLKTLPDGNKVDERAYEDLTAMLEACRKAGLQPKICSSYRTQSKQTYLYNNKIARLRNAGYSRKAAEAEAGRLGGPPRNQRASGRAGGGHCGQVLPAFRRGPGEDGGAAVADGALRRVRLHPPLSHGEKRPHRRGLRALALPLCGPGGGPGHPGQRALHGRVLTAAGGDSGKTGVNMAEAAEAVSAFCRTCPR